MKIFVPTLLVLCLVASSFALTCYQNNTQSAALTFNPNDIVGQHIDGSYVTESLFLGAALFRADNVPVSGTFYILPGQSSNLTEAIFNTTFSSTSDIIYANGTATLSIGYSYTFLWARDGTGNSTDIWQAGDWLAGSHAFGENFTNVDQSSEFCFASVNHVPSHVIVGITDSTPNTVVSNPNQSTRSNRYLLGVPLMLNITDFDLDQNPSSGNLTVNVTLTTITGAYPAFWNINVGTDVFVDMLVNSVDFVSFWGPLQPMRDTVNRLKVYWGANAPIKFMVTFTVSDNGHNGVCADTGASPCVIWTSSTTVFATSGL